MIIQQISRILSDFTNLAPLFAAACLVIALFGIASLPLDYHEAQLYPKTLNPESPLHPYDRGGTPFNTTVVAAQYPENSPMLGYVTAYLTPVTRTMAAMTLHTGTTIVSHPGGIIDEILYNTRGLDTVAETSILLSAFTIASYLFRRVR